MWQSKKRQPICLRFSMLVKLICVGKIKDDYLKEGINKYLKRIKPYANLSVFEVREGPTHDNAKNIVAEGKEILALIKENDYVVSLCISGVNLASPELASYVKHHYTYSSSPLTFVIGGAYGLSDDVIKRTDFKLSLGKNTYPYQLARLIFIEQLYRAFTIIKGQNYHQ